MTYIPGGSEPRREPLGPTAYTTQNAPYPEYAPRNVAPRKSRTGLVVGLSIAAVVVLVGVAALVLALTGHSPVKIPGTNTGMTVQGQITVSDCGSVGYSDVRPGTEVDVVDQSGKVLAVSQLTQGAVSCTYHFTLNNVPAGQPLYGISISHRGTVHFTEDQMRAGPELTLGN